MFLACLCVPYRHSSMRLCIPCIVTNILKSIKWIFTKLTVVIRFGTDKCIRFWGQEVKAQDHGIKYTEGGVGVHYLPCCIQLRISGCFMIVGQTVYLNCAVIKLVICSQIWGFEVTGLCRIPVVTCYRMLAVKASDFCLEVWESALQWRRRRAIKDCREHRMEMSLHSEVSYQFLAFIFLCHYVIQTSFCHGGSNK